jgi:putative pyruvate formate lyase activating enzyme
VDRTAGQLGTCQSTGSMRVSHAVPHFGEEPPITGSRGSGTVFFAGCNLGCVYCQNWQISASRTAGRVVDPEGLARVFLALQQQGVHNLNLVTGTHFLPGILEALKLARRLGCRLPVVWNSSGYERLEAIQALSGVVDVYLVDARYADPELARRYSRAPDYPEVNDAAMQAMFAQVGHLQVDAEGIATRGLIVRHLVLPNHLENTMSVLEILSERFGPDLHLSLMAQYHPAFRANLFPDINRTLDPDEAACLPAWAERHGFKGWVQSLEAHAVCNPDFEDPDAPFDFEAVKPRR